MLLEYRFKNKTFHLKKADNIPEKNSYTVIVGKNGAGKSRLMKAIIEAFIGKRDRLGFLTQIRTPDSGLFWGFPTDNIRYEKLPSKIIAVSTSPFDKFPYKIIRDDDKYSYLGLRNLRSSNLGMAYMDRIYISLLKAVIYSPDRIDKIFEVLGFLGFSPRVDSSYSLEFPIRDIRDALLSSNPVDTLAMHIESTNAQPGSPSRTRGFYRDGKIDRDLVERIISIYNRSPHLFIQHEIRVNLMAGGVKINDYDGAIIEDYLSIAELGIIRLREIKLEKNDGQLFLLGDASSGEQSVVLNILGIASQITDNSLICIDEPEVCLHPEWQEKYMSILINTFRGFNGCHFLIATHSPLMVSKLKDQNCYVLKMDSGEIISAAKVNNKSVDFQLANTFNTPGYKNEYLTRELVTALTLFGETGKIDTARRQQLNTLLLLKDHLDESDPVRRLMELTQEALQESL